MATCSATPGVWQTRPTQLRSARLEAGDYPIGVTVSDGQSSAVASFTVSVTAGDLTDPEPPTNPDPPVNPSPPVNPDPPGNPGPPTNPEPEPKLTVSATPSGSAPWGVRYDVTATGFPEGSTLETVCRVQIDPSDNETKITDNQIDKDSFACFYAIGSNEGSYYTDSGFVRVVPKDGGKPLAEVTLEPDINDQTDPLYFSGTWKYTYEQAGAEPETGTFSVVREGPGIGGQSEDGAFQMGLEEFRDEALPYFESAKASGYLNPDPLLDGTQRYTLVDGVGISVVLEKVKQVSSSAEDTAKSLTDLNL